MDNSSNSAGTPAPSLPQSRAARQRAPVRGSTAVVIGVLYVFILIVFMGLVVIGISIEQKKIAKANADSAFSADQSENEVFSVEEEKEITFLGNVFLPVYHNTKDTVESYIFAKSSDTPSTWDELITFYKYTSAKGTSAEMDSVAQALSSTVKKNGGVIVDARTVKDTANGQAINFLIYSFEYGEKDEVVITFEKVYTRDKQLLTVAYAVKFKDSSSVGAADQASEYLKNSKDDVSAEFIGADIAADYWNN